MDDITLATAGQATGELAVLSITKNSEGRKPLRVTFRLDASDPESGNLVKGEPIDADFSAAEIETFGAFRRSVANRFGLWPSHWTEGRGREGQRTWSLEIRGAFKKGEAKSP